MAAARPNVIVITTDQQRVDTLGCYGASFAGTPNIDRLGAGGVVFRRAYCANPVCNPSRATIFSGKYVSRHGVWNVGINLPPDEVLISHRLAAEGYRTHYVGKTHFNHWHGAFDETIESMQNWERRFPDFKGPYYGFQTVEMSMGHASYGFFGHYGAWVKGQVTPEQFELFHNARRIGVRDFQGNAHDWDLPTRLHQSVWAADCAIEFLRRSRNEAGKPFLLAVGFADPHHPHALPTDWTDRVDAAAVPMPDYDEGELDDKPETYRLAHEGRIANSHWRGQFMVAGQADGADFQNLPERDVRMGRAYYYSMVRIIDAQIGRLMAELRDLGLDRDTLIVFTTDHGEMLGDHGIWAKGPFHVEQLLHVPMIVRFPRGLAAGRVSDALVSHVDLVPTILGAAGLAPARELDGVDLGPLVRGETDAVHDAVFAEHVDDPAKLRLKTIITRDRKLTHYAGHPFGEMYDLDADPREKANHWNDDSRAPEKAALLRRLIDFLEPLDKRLPRPYYV